MDNGDKDKDDIFKEVLIQTEEYTIGIDELQRVRISVDSEIDEHKDEIISTLVKTVMDIDNLPMESEDRDRYKRDIANIYQIGLSRNKEEAIVYANNLKEIIETNLLMNRKKDLFQPTIIGFVIIVVVCMKFINNNIGEIFIYGSIGGILSVIIQNNKFNIDYKVDKKLLKFEALKLVLLSNIMSLIGNLAIESQFIFSNFYQTQSFKYLVYILCGYSQTFIPNILKNFELKSDGEN
mgnify:CR=1 FL=1